MYNVKISDDELIRLPYVWVIELFPPSYARGLAEGIRRARWKSVPIWRGSVSEVVDRARVEGRVNSTTIANLSSNPPGPSMISGIEYARLPEIFAGAEIRLVELGNSLTAIVVGFTLTPGASKQLDDVLRIMPEPRVEKIATSGGRPVFGAHSVLTRLDESNRLVVEQRARIHDEARKWLTDRIPGVFASEKGRSSLPVMDLVTTRVVEPFATPFRDGGNFLSALGLGSEFFKTSAEELPGVELSNVFSQPALGQKDFISYSLSYREVPKINGDVGESQNSGEESLNNRINAAAPRLLSRLALSDYLEMKLRQSAYSRDLAHDEHGRRPVRSTKRIRESFLRGSIDTVAVATGVRELVGDLPSYKWGVVEFSVERRLSPAPATDQAGHDRSLVLENLAKSQDRLARTLLEEEAATRSILGVVASLNSSIESIRSQRWAIGIAFISLVAAVFALGLTLEGAKADELGLLKFLDWLGRL